MYKEKNSKRISVKLYFLFNLQVFNLESTTCTYHPKQCKSKTK